MKVKCLKNLEVINYEHNLTMHYEAKRKELDIMISSSIPQQLSNMKTLLWINFLMIGLMLQFIEKFPLPDTIVSFFLLSLCSILLIMIAILTNRTIDYGVPINIEHMNTYDDNIWTISQATLDMLNAAHQAVQENRKVLIKRAELMHLSTLFSTVSILFIVLSFFMKQINF